MDTRLKKFIAVEGLILIIVAIVVAANLLFCRKTMPAYAITLTMVYPMYFMVRTRIAGPKIFPADSKYKILSEIIIFLTPIIWFVSVAMLSLKGLYAREEYVTLSSELTSSMFLMFFYLAVFYIVNFIVWAVRTLRGK